MNCPRNFLNNVQELVSVCLPTYNGACFLEEALASIEKQTYKNIEVVVSDDQSTDNTLDLIFKFKERVNFPVHIFNHLPAGIGANWNNCIKKSSGNYIKFLFQDDVLYPTCIEECMKVFSKNKGVGLAVSKRKFILEKNLTVEQKQWIDNYSNLQDSLDLPKKPINFLDKRLFKNPSFFRPPLNKIGEPSCVIFLKSITKRTGFFREDLEQILDYEFYYRILKYKKIAVINKELVGFRIHEAQATNINRNRNISDYRKYDEILYQHFFWYLPRTEQKRLLKYFNPRVFKIVKGFLNA